MDKHGCIWMSVWSVLFAVVVICCGMFAHWLDPEAPARRRAQEEWRAQCHAAGKAIVKDEYAKEFCIDAERLNPQRIKVVYQ